MESRSEKLNLNYFAVIGDFIDSRKIENRDLAQAKFRHALEKINRDFSKTIASKFTITLGDEFQGLLYPGAPIFKILDVIEMELLAYPFRIGIGFGSVTQPVNPNISIGADGKAYWNARSAIEFIHDKTDYGTSRTYFLGFDNTKNRLINDLLASTDLIKSKWSRIQRETFSVLLDMGIYEEDFSQKTIAQFMRISEVALYKRLKAGNIKLYLRCRKNLEISMSEWADD